MTKKTKKWYVVWKGKKTGVFTTRDDCKAAVHGVNGSQYKSFTSLEEAEFSFSQKYQDIIANGQKEKQERPQVQQLIKRGVIEDNSISVDAACSSNPGVLERRGVDTSSTKKLFQSTQYPLGTTNVGEWLAIIEGMQYLIKNNQTSRTLYSDSRVAIKWIHEKNIKTTLPRNNSTRSLWIEIDRQLKRLQENQHPIIIHKRKTKEWGEIPADFGRK